MTCVISAPQTALTHTAYPIVISPNAGLKCNLNTNYLQAFCNKSGPKTDPICNKSGPKRTQICNKTDLSIRKGSSAIISLTTKK